MTVLAVAASIWFAGVIVGVIGILTDNPFLGYVWLGTIIVVFLIAVVSEIYEHLR